MNNPISGIVQVMGEPDGGKTTFALTTGAHPGETAFFDDDLKTQAIADMLKANGTPFGEYHNLTRLSVGMKEIQFHDLVLSIIDAMPRGKYKVLVFDPFARFESTFFPYVQKNSAKFRDVYSPKGDIKGAQIAKASLDYEDAVLSKLLEIAPLVILTAHLKDQSIGSAKTGKEIPECRKPIVEKTRLRVWLRHNPNGTAPIGLVLKRLSKVSVNGSGIQVQNILPLKVNPCTWKKIIEYWNNPIGDTTPSTDETPNDFEWSIIDGTLTADQKDALRINRVAADKPEEQTKVSPAPTQTFDSLIAQYGIERVLAETQNGLPTTPAEWAMLQSKLNGEGLPY
jgi:hypothetical protein